MDVVKTFINPDLRKRTHLICWYYKFSMLLLKWTDFLKLSCILNTYSLTFPFLLNWFRSTKKKVKLLQILPIKAFFKKMKSHPKLEMQMHLSSLGIKTLTQSLGYKSAVSKICIPKCRQEFKTNLIIRRI